MRERITYPLARLHCRRNLTRQVKDPQLFLGLEIEAEIHSTSWSKMHELHSNSTTLRTNALRETAGVRVPARKESQR